MDTVSKVVMIADGDNNVRQLVSRFVSEAGYTVIFATDGYEALDNARKAPPLVILTDILLPRLDGLALCRLIKGDAATKNIVTVIVFSVLAAEERALKAGADAFIHKPLEKTRLLMVLEEATRKRNTIA
jgi:CheY-like chemotaxis protein